MAGLTPAIVDVGSEPSFIDVLEMQLLHSLRTNSGQARNQAIRLAIHAGNGGLVAGPSGRTTYGWLPVDMLWVAPEQLRKGYGKQLLNAALQMAHSLGCHSAWLGTSNPGAFKIWKRLGFSEFGRLENAPHHHPAGHRRWFLQKSPI